MSLSFHQRQFLYDELSRLLRTDIPFPRAIELLRHEPGGAGMRRFLDRVLGALRSGCAPAEALARAGAGQMEVALLSAADRVGRAEAIYQRLAEYFALMARIRGRVLGAIAYPIFIVHLAAVLLNVPSLFQGGGWRELAWNAGMMLVVFYLVLGGAWLAGRMLLAAAGKGTLADGLLNAIPVFGSARQGFVLARFCSTWQVQIEAGIAPGEALRAAATASRSGTLIRMAKHAGGRILHGESPADILADCNALPAGLRGALVTGEASGTLDEALGRWAAYYAQRAEARAEALAAWLPRLLYLGVLLFIGYRIITLYRSSLRGLEELLF